MGTYVVRRLLAIVPVLFGLSIVLFAFLRLLPGDPARIIAGAEAAPEAVEQIRRQLGLDRPIPIQYLDYLGDLSRGDLGSSLINGRPVLQEFMARFPATIELALAAMLLAVVFGVGLGRLAARRPGSWTDTGATAASLFGVSIPVFVLGLTLAYIFGVALRVLPTAGRIDPRLSIADGTGLLILDSLVQLRPDALADVLRHLALPAVTLATIPLATIARMTRASAIEVSSSDFVQVARAKGLTESRVESRHIMRNAWLPVVTVVGLQMGALLAGAVITETVFAWNGVGRWVVDAIQSRDYFVVQASIMLFSVIFVVVNLVVDVAYAVLDPRIRYS